MKKHWIILGLFFIAQTAWAISNNSNPLLLTLRNRSTDTLTYTGTTHTNPSNLFSVLPTHILPGGSAIIIGKTNTFFDLSGKLHFKDSADNDTILTITVYQKIHYEQPVFEMINPRFISFIQSKTANNNPDLRTLSYNFAVVDIENNMSSLIKTSP